MIYFLNASNDATIYSVNKKKNTGLDQLLELNNIKDSLNSPNGVSRILLKFDINDATQYITQNSITVSDVKLILRETVKTNVPIDSFDIMIYATSGSWSNGNGYFYESVNSSGVTWTHRDILAGNRWLSGSYSQYATGSSPNGDGGIWWTNYSSSQSYSYETRDINVSVKNIFNAWANNSIPNDGILLKLSNSYEFIGDNTLLSFYSRETNTIYKPKLLLQWDDSVFSTGSLTPLSLDSAKLSITNMQKIYKSNDVYKFKVSGRELNSVKTFNSTLITTQKYLPSSTYYQIKDFLSEDILIPFSDYTKLSCDSNGNYFKLNLKNWESRKYKIEFKIINNDTTYYYEPINNVFEITN